MKPSSVPLHRLIGASLFVTLIAGCGSQLKEEELAGVTKDWALTLRASQIIPIYPLREDLQVGDVFLVSTPIQKQQEQFKDKGFLPLDQQIARLPVGARPAQLSTYDDFYSGSYGLSIDPAADVPTLWQFPSGADAWLEPAGKPLTKGATAWGRSPRAFFPTYTFKVRSGAGINLAFPIHAVPVGLAIMGTDAATGSVQIRDSYTYGLSMTELEPFVRDWQNSHSAFLSSERKSSPTDVYVRVVNRVFLAGSLAVTLTNDRAFSAQGKAGAAPEANVPVLDQGDVDANLQKIKAAAAAHPASNIGGAVDVSFATSRVVKADETFDRPLVIGYLALDYPVMSNGRLGAPIATRTQVVADSTRVAGEISPEQRQVSLYSQAVSSSPEEDAKSVLDAAARQLGPRFNAAYLASKGQEPVPASLPGLKYWSRFQDAMNQTGVTDEDVVPVLDQAWQEFHNG